MQTIKLTPDNNRLVGNLGNGIPALVLCDSSEAFSLELPDCDSCQHVFFSIFKTGAKDVTLTPILNQKINGEDSLVLSGARTSVTIYSDGENYYAIPNVTSSEVLHTEDGGVAVRMINDTGASTVKGYVLQPSSSIDLGVKLIVKDIPNPIGVFYESGIADGQYTWVVVSGIADVYYVASTTRNYFCRGFLTTDGGSYVAGQALNEALPSSPFASDKHFYEIGHVLETRTGEGLAKTLIHFN